jgi:hypothetical protein
MQMISSYNQPHDREHVMQVRRESYSSDSQLLWSLSHCLFHLHCYSTLLIQPCSRASLVVVVPECFLPTSPAFRSSLCSLVVLVCPGRSILDGPASCGRDALHLIGQPRAEERQPRPEERDDNKTLVGAVCLPLVRIKLEILVLVLYCVTKLHQGSSPLPLRRRRARMMRRVAAILSELLQPLAARSHMYSTCM